MTHTDPIEELTDPFDDVNSLEDKLWLILEEAEILDNLRGDQVRALIPMARGDKLATIARNLGKGEKTIDRWAKDPTFKKAVNATVGYIYTHGLRTAAFAAVEAVGLLREAVRDKEAKLSDRIRAAAMILDQGDRWQNLGIERRLTELERRLASRVGELGADENDYVVINRREDEDDEDPEVEDDA